MRLVRVGYFCKEGKQLQESAVRCPKPIIQTSLGLPQHPYVLSCKISKLHGVLSLGISEMENPSTVVKYQHFHGRDLEAKPSWGVLTEPCLWLADAPVSQLTALNAPPLSEFRSCDWKALDQVGRAHSFDNWYCVFTQIWHGSCCGKDLIHLEADLYSPDMLIIFHLSLTFLFFIIGCLMHILTPISSFIFPWIQVKFHFKKLTITRKNSGEQSYARTLLFDSYEQHFSLSSYNKTWAPVQTHSFNSIDMIFILKTIYPHVCISHGRLKCIFKWYVVWSLQ